MAVQGLGGDLGAGGRASDHTDRERQRPGSPTMALRRSRLRHDPVVANKRLGGRAAFKSSSVSIPNGYNNLESGSHRHRLFAQ